MQKVILSHQSLNTTNTEEEKLIKTELLIFESAALPCFQK